MACSCVPISTTEACPTPCCSAQTAVPSLDMVTRVTGSVVETVAGTDPPDTVRIKTAPTPDPPIPEGEHTRGLDDIGGCIVDPDDAFDAPVVASRRVTVLTVAEPDSVHSEPSGWGAVMARVLTGAGKMADGFWVCRSAGAGVDEQADKRRAADTRPTAAADQTARRTG